MNKLEIRERKIERGGDVSMYDAKEEEKQKNEDMIIF